MKKLNDQLSNEELDLVTGGTSSNGILSSHQSNGGSIMGPSCSGKTCRGGCTPGCQPGCSGGCSSAEGKNGYK